MQTSFSPADGSTPAQTKINRNPYIELAERVNRTAERLSSEAQALTVLLTAQSQRSLSDVELMGLERLYTRMDRQEQSLADYLTPTV